MSDGRRDTQNKQNNIGTVGVHQPYLMGISDLPSHTIMYRGYIKVWRKTKDWAFADRPIALALWVTLLFEANHKATRKIYKGQIIDVLPGQLLTGRKYLSKISGISESTIEKYLKWFESEQQIAQQTSSQNRLITILNWDKYQGNGTKLDSPSDNKKTTKYTTKRQQKDTPKNVYNDKNVKNVVPPALDSLKDYFKELKYPGEAEAFFDHFTSNGWRIGGKTKMIDWQASARNWVRKAKEFGKLSPKVNEAPTRHKNNEPKVEGYVGPTPEFKAMVKKLAGEKTAKGGG